MKTKLFFCISLFFLCLSAEAQWILQSNGFASFEDVDCIFTVNQNIAWGTVNQSKQFTHTTDGNTWIADTIVIPGSNMNISDLFPLNGDTAWACLYNPAGGGGIVKTEDGGLTWTQQSSGSVYLASSSYPDDIYFWNDTEGVCIGDPVLGTYEIYTTTDGGNTWNPVSSSNIPPAVSGEYGTSNMYSVIGNTVWFATTNGRVYKSQDKGYTWNVYNTGNNIFFSRRIKFLNANYGIITNTVSPLVTSAFYTSDGGVTWNVLAYTGLFFGTDFDAVPGTPATFVSAGSSIGGIGSSVSDDGGLTWLPLDTTYSFWAIDFADNQTGFASNGILGSGISKFTGSPLHVKEVKTNDGFQVYPNPVRTTASFEFDVKEKSYVLLKVFDALGNQVSTATSSFYQPGTHRISWNASELKNGIYFCQLILENSLITKRIMIIK
jgi:photosystem II stability/assembly factor-like uncharacterized protein